MRNEGTTFGFVDSERQVISGTTPTGYSQSVPQRKEGTDRKGAPWRRGRGAGGDRTDEARAEEQKGRRGVAGDEKNREGQRDGETEGRRKGEGEDKARTVPAGRSNAVGAIREKALGRGKRRRHGCWSTREGKK